MPSAQIGAIGSTRSSSTNQSNQDEDIKPVLNPRHVVDKRDPKSNEKQPRRQSRNKLSLELKPICPVTSDLLHQVQSVTLKTGDRYIAEHSSVKDTSSPETTPRTPRTPLSGLKSPRTRQGRPAHFYPSDPDLPWHFCWIDDGNIAGMSAPCNREHYKALIRANVGLVVNLTEVPMTPASKDNDISFISSCGKCGSHCDIDCSPDIFDEISTKDDLACLFIPIKDGSVPHYEQVTLFLHHVNDALSKGRKVAVHCQAGVGRTGVLLAIYLMEKYHCHPDEAIKRLRHIRPQSMRFVVDDWYGDPFRILQDRRYRRNRVQERFVEMYYNQVMVPRLGLEPTSPSDSEAEEQYSTHHLSQEKIDDFLYDVSADDDLALYGDAIIDLELRKTLQELQRRWACKRGPSREHFKLEARRNYCSICECIPAIGPAPIIPGHSWPPSSSVSSHPENSSPSVTVPFYFVEGI